MRWLYNIGIFIYSLLIRIIALFNPKAKLFVNGRNGIFETLKLKIDPNKRPIWFHFASLGEFEQGRPLLEKLKTEQLEQQIIVTFFSPSGYEIRKNYALADVFYLPLDTAKNARKFIEIVNPKLAVFTKYEFWYHYFKTLHEKQIPLYVISSIFRPDQVFFKGYGGFYREILKYVTRFFVQNEESVNLLKSIGIEEVNLSGDTRFDRVYENAQHPKKIEIIEDFAGNSPVFIAGSTWPDDEKLLVALTEKHADWKFIIAPHEVDASHIVEIEKLFPLALKFSEAESGKQKAESEKLKVENPQPTTHNSQPTTQILIIDNIGLLSSLYQYGKIAYIGGGFGVGIHNTLEAAAFGLPVVFGPKYDKFQEAKDLIEIGAAKSISNTEELIAAFEFFKANDQASADAEKYVEAKKGATDIILRYIKP